MAKPSRLRAVRTRTASEAPQARLDGDLRKRQAAEACANLIASRGYSDTSIRDVAATMGISTGTLLHHFSSKDDLLTATLLYVSQGILALMQTAAAKSDDPPERLREVVRALLRRSKQVDITWRVWIAFWHEAAIKPQLATVASGLTEVSERLLTDIISDGVARGRLTVEEPDQRAAELAALVDGIAIRLYGESGRWSHERGVALVDQMIADWTVK